MTRTLFSVLSLTLLLAPLTACDPEPINEFDAALELEFDEDPVTTAVVADELEADLIDTQVVTCTPTTTFELPFELDELGLAADGGAEPWSNPVPGGGGGCGSSWIIYGTWVNTSQCNQGGCPPGTLRQAKFDTVLNNCGIQYQIVHTRCHSC